MQNEEIIEFLLLTPSVVSDQQITYQEEISSFELVVNDPQHFYDSIKWLYTNLHLKLVCSDPILLEDEFHVIFVKHNANFKDPERDISKADTVWLHKIIDSAKEVA